MVLQSSSSSIPTTFSSAQTLYPLNNNSAFLPPTGEQPGNHHSIFCLCEFDYFRYLIVERGSLLCGYLMIPHELGLTSQLSFDPCSHRNRNHLASLRTACLVTHHLPSGGRFWLQSDGDGGLQTRVLGTPSSTNDQWRGPSFDFR
ncbi:uncharacterized protein LOC118555206 isoform X2 [Halichoerus grypus]